MLQVDELLAIGLGILEGYVGLPLLFHLVRPVSRWLMRPWGKEATFALSLTIVCTFCFLGSVEMAVVQMCLNMFAHEAGRRGTLGKLTSLGVFVGFTSSVIIPRVELKLRRMKGVL